MGYCKGIAESLGIKSVSSLAEVEALMVKAQKRRANILKQEKAIHPHTYLEPFESDDIWNHVNIAHNITDDCFKREELLKEIKVAIEKDVSSVSSATVIHGGLKTGKTWLCAQLPSLMSEATTLLRFCGLTSLTSTIRKLLYGLSKQLSAICNSSILKSNMEHLNISHVFQCFKELLDQVSQTSTKPVVLVLDGFDKLAESDEDLSTFISLCDNAIPTNVSLVVSVTTKSAESEFFDPTLTISEEEVLKKFEDAFGKFL